MRAAILAVLLSHRRDVRGLGGAGTHLAGRQPRAGAADAAGSDRFSDSRCHPGAELPAHIGASERVAPSQRPSWHCRHPGDRRCTLPQPKTNPLARRGLGSGPPAAVRDLRAPDSRRPATVPRAWQLRDLDSQLLVCRLAVRLRRAGQARLEPGSHLRVSAAACHHLRQRTLRHHVLPRDHAAHRAGLRHADEPGDGGERGRKPERGGIDLHGADRGAADDPARSCRG